MNPFISRLLAHIPSEYGLDPMLIPALQIDGTGYLSLVGATLYITTNQGATSYELYNLSLEQLANQISSGGNETYFIGSPNGSMLAAGAIPSTLKTGIVELLSLPNGETNATLPATLYLPSNEIYFLLGQQARMLQGRLRSANLQIAQISLQSSKGRILDWWGASTGIPRYQGEPDSLYAQRIVGMRFRPTQNGYSIQRIMKDLGYSADVTDTGPGTFTVSIIVPSSPPSGFIYSLGQLADILTQVKSAGYRGSVTVQSTLSDAVSITDSLTASLNVSVWKIGNITIGQFTI